MHWSSPLQNLVIKNKQSAKEKENISSLLLISNIYLSLILGKKKKENDNANLY